MEVSISPGTIVIKIVLIKAKISMKTKMIILPIIYGIQVNYFSISCVDNIHQNVVKLHFV